MNKFIEKFAWYILNKFSQFLEEIDKNKCIYFSFDQISSDYSILILFDYLSRFEQKTKYFCFSAFQLLSNVL